MVGVSVLVVKVLVVGDEGVPGTDGVIDGPEDALHEWHDDVSETHKYGTRWCCKLMI